MSNVYNKIFFILKNSCYIYVDEERANSSHSIVVNRSLLDSLGQAKVSQGSQRPEPRSGSIEIATPTDPPPNEAQSEEHRM
jgi:hypothetical protein